MSRATNRYAESQAEIVAAWPLLITLRAEAPNPAPEASCGRGGVLTVQASGMAKKWMDLSPRTRRLLVIAGTTEAVLKIVALIDLARRPADQVRGSKPRWAAAIALVNSFGAVPIAYFVRGRQSSSPAA